MIELKGVNKTYRSKSGDVKAIINAYLTLPSKGMVFINGKSGSGKTTLLNLIGGLDKADSGEIIYKGKDITKFNNYEYDYYRSNEIGFVFQEYNLLEKFTVNYNILLAAKINGQKVTNNDINELLVKVGLEGLGERKINELSGGQKQRVAIARALIKNPSFILADEPTGNLDSYNSKLILDLLKELSNDLLVVVVSHDIENANNYNDYIVTINDGIINSNCHDDKVVSELKLVKTKLSIKDIFKLSFSNLFHKKVKLFMAIILIAFSLSLFGLSIIQEKLKVNDELYRLANEINTKYLNVAFKQEDYVDTDYNKEQLESLSKINNNYQLNHCLFDGDIRLYFVTDYFDDTKTNLYYSDAYSKLIDCVHETTEDKFDYPLIGNFPSNFDEMVITKQIADYFIEYGVYEYNEKYDGTNLNTSKLYKPSSYKDLINENVYLQYGFHKIKISGIINDDLSKYDKLKKIKASDYVMNRDLYLMINELKNKYEANFFVKEGFVNNIELVKDNDVDVSLVNYFSPVMSLTEFKPLNVYTDTGIKKINELDDYDIIVSYDYLDYISNDNFTKELNKYLVNEAKKKIYVNTNELEKKYIIKYIKDHNIINSNVNIDLNNSEEYQNQSSYLFRIVGVSVNRIGYANKSTIEPYYHNNILYRVYFPYQTKEEFMDIMKDFPIENGNYIINYDYAFTISDYVNIFNILSKLLLTISLFIALIAVITLFNFIGVSITDHHKDIGILRSLGVRKGDISKIYAIQGIFIGVIAYIISFGLLHLYIILENKLFFNSITDVNRLFQINLAGFSYSVIIDMFIFLFGFILLSSLSTTSKISKMRIIDAINSI